MSDDAGTVNARTMMVFKFSNYNNGLGQDEYQGDVIYSAHSLSFMSFAGYIIFDNLCCK